MVNSNVNNILDYFRFNKKFIEYILIQLPDVFIFFRQDL